MHSRGETSDRSNLQRLGYEMSQKQTEFSTLVYGSVKGSNFIVIAGYKLMLYH